MSKRDYKIQIHDDRRGWEDVLDESNTVEHHKSLKAANDRAKELVERTRRFYRVVRMSKNGR